MSCEQCPLYGQPKVQGRGIKGGLAVVGEAPGNNEVRQGKPFIGASGKLLRQSLRCAGIDSEKIWITNAVLCHPEGNATPPKEAIELCRARLLEELKDCQKVLLCGATALESLTSETSGIMKARGKAVFLDEIGIPAVLTVHPALVLRNPFYFQDFAKDIEKVTQIQIKVGSPPLPEIIFCRNVRDVKEAFQDLKSSDYVAVDIETTGLDPLESEIILIGFQGNPNRTYQIPARLLRNHLVQLALEDLFLSVETSGHNAASFDCKWIKHKFGIDWRPSVDTMLAHYTLDERSKDESDKYGSLGRTYGVHGLKTLARERYNAPDYDVPLKTRLSEILKERRVEERKAKKEGRSYTLVQPNFGDIPEEELSEYLARDTLYTYLLTKDLLKEMKDENTRWLHDNVLLPGALALKDIELTGVLINPKPLLEADKRLKKEIQKSLEKLLEIAENSDFNVNSPKQVGELLFNKLKLKKISGYSTSKEVLNQLKNQHPAVELILDCRQKEKLRNTYIRGILQRLSSDGRLRGEFLLHGTVTGRLASRNPNLQNIPVLVGPIIRDAFVATPGWTMVEADYSQLELRIAAWYSHDERLLRYYREGKDVHRMVAAEVFDVPSEQVTQMQRYIAKYIDFGIIYGRQAASLAHGELECSVGEAQSYIDAFLGRFEGLSSWIRDAHKQIQDFGYIETPLGRRRRFPFLFDRNRAESFRQAVNSPIQALASDLCLTALTRLHQRLNPNECRILLTVHDSILFEIRNDCLDSSLNTIRYEMENNCVINSPIPFKVDVKTGQRWGTLDKRQEK